MVTQSDADAAGKRSPLDVYVTSMATHSAEIAFSSIGFGAALPSIVEPAQQASGNAVQKSLASYLASAGSVCDTNSYSKGLWGDLVGDVTLPGFLDRWQSMRSSRESWCPMCKSPIEETLMLPGGVPRPRSRSHSCAAAATIRCASWQGRSPSPQYVATQRPATTTPTPAMHAGCTTPTRAVLQSRSASTTPMPYRDTASPPPTSWWEQASKVERNLGTPVVRWPEKRSPTPLSVAGGRSGQFQPPRQISAQIPVPPRDAVRSPYAEDLPSQLQRLPRRSPLQSRILVGGSISPIGNADRPGASSPSDSGPSNPRARKRAETKPAPRTGHWEDEDEDGVAGYLCRQQLGFKALLRGDCSESIEKPTTVQRTLRKYKRRQRRRKALNKPVEDVEAIEAIVQRQQKLSELAEKQQEWRRQQEQAQRMKHLRAHFKEQMQLQAIREAEEEAEKAAKVVQEKKAMRIKRIQRLAKEKLSNGIDRRGAIKDISADDPDVVALRMRHMSEERAAALARQTDTDRSFDRRLSTEAANRYELGRDGILNIQEVMSTLEDVGLKPLDAVEKAAVRRTLLNTISEGGGETLSNMTTSSESEGSEGSPSERSAKKQILETFHFEDLQNAKQRADMRAKHERLRQMKVALKDLPDLFMRVRASLMDARFEALRKLWEKYDVCETGEMDFECLKVALDEQGILPPDKTAMATFHEWLRRKLAVAAGTGEEVKEVRSGSSETASSPKSEKKCQRIGTKELHEIDLTAQSYQFSDFELISNYLTEEKGRRQAEEQFVLARQCGVSPGSSLFVEFRHEFSRHFAVFNEFDQDGSGFLDKGECWVALNILGLMPLGYEDKAAFMRVVHAAYMDHYFKEMSEEDRKRRRSSLKKLMSSPSRRGSRLSQPDSPLEGSPALSRANSPVCRGWSRANSPLGTPRSPTPGADSDHNEASDRIVESEEQRTRRMRTTMKIFNNSIQREGPLDPQSSQAEKPVDEDIDVDFRVSFPGFLRILSRCRSWVKERISQDLHQVFDRHAKKRNFHNQLVLDVPEVCRAMELLGMQPQSFDEQAQFKTLLNDADEWGYQPQMVSFHTFVTLVRQAQEWTSAAARKEEREFAKAEFGIPAHVCNEYRLAYDALDSLGTGLDITKVRKCFKLFGRSITSEHLRELFASLDADQSGVLDFLEFLNLVHELDRYDEQVRQEKLEKQQQNQQQPLQEEVASQAETQDDDWRQLMLIQQEELTDEDSAQETSEEEEKEKDDEESSDGFSPTDTYRRATSPGISVAPPAEGGVGEEANKVFLPEDGLSSDEGEEEHTWAQRAVAETWRRCSIQKS